MQNQTKQHLGKTHIPEKQLEKVPEDTRFRKWILKILEEKGCANCNRSSKEEAKPLRRWERIKGGCGVDCHGPSSPAFFSPNKK